MGFLSVFIRWGNLPIGDRVDYMASMAGTRGSNSFAMDRRHARSFIWAVDSGVLGFGHGVTQKIWDIDPRFCIDGGNGFRSVSMPTPNHLNHGSFDRMFLAALAITMSLVFDYDVVLGGHA